MSMEIADAATAEISKEPSKPPKNPYISPSQSSIRQRRNVALRAEAHR